MAHDLLLFVTWKTWAAVPSIDADIATQLQQHLPRLAALENAAVVELAIVPTHVHAVLEVAALPDMPKLVQRLKGASARFANRDGWSKAGRHLRWERGYDARTISRQALPTLRSYLDQQADRHHRPLLARWSAVGTRAA